MLPVWMLKHICFALYIRQFSTALQNPEMLPAVVVENNYFISKSQVRN